MALFAHLLIFANLEPNQELIFWEGWTTMMKGIQATPGDGGAAAPLPDYETTFPKLVRCLAVMVSLWRIIANRP